MKERVKRRMVV
jgi:hypothetical protein